MWGLENSREDTLVDALAIPESEKQGKCYNYAAAFLGEILGIAGRFC
ncbi:hypothetical protein TIFTF001_036847 [Ficus carica]|uniref:Uncharacterized protein n=1 Tax=Ficus carica TaxID=3494 RepID=A0AA88E571_FICCA|nr:hypothetical protein TIFTF001_036847 [Ficus carica]